MDKSYQVYTTMTENTRRTLYFPLREQGRSQCLKHPTKPLTGPRVNRKKSLGLPFIPFKVTFLSAPEETGKFLCPAQCRVPHYTDPISYGITLFHTKFYREVKEEGGEKGGRR